MQRFTKIRIYLYVRIKYHIAQSPFALYITWKDYGTYAIFRHEHFDINAVLFVELVS